MTPPSPVADGSPASTMRFGISVPPHGSYANPNVMADLAARAEDAGWDGFFVWDHLTFNRGYQGPIIDPWIALAAIACATATIRLGPMVTPLARRRPAKVARETVTLDHLSNGRLILGVGLGYPADSEFEDFGEDGDARVRADKLDEALTIITGLWSGETFAFDGRYFTVRETRFIPTPVQAPRIPIWVGGYWPNRRPFRRAARWDGVLPGRLSLERRRKWSPSMIPSSDVVEMRDYISQHRDSPAPHTFALGGYSTGEDMQADSALVTEYAEAGVNWWFENLHDFRGDLDFTRRRIQLGPPRWHR